MNDVWQEILKTAPFWMIFLALAIPISVLIISILVLMFSE